MTDEIMSITLDCQYPTLNEYINVERNNRYSANSQKQKYTNITKMLAKHCNKVTEKADMLFEWHVATKHDHDNIAFAKKFILDGFKQAGVIKDDKQAYIGHLYDEFYKDTRSYVIVHVLKHQSSGRLRGNRK